MSAGSRLEDHGLGGQVALVTGGGRGIGRAIAEGLGAAGAAVVVLARSQDELLETVDRTQRAGGRALAIVADVTERQAVQRAVEQTERELGPVERAAEAVMFLASGRADALTGRFIDIVRDDLVDLVERADQVVRDDLLALRLRE